MAITLNVELIGNKEASNRYDSSIIELDGKVETQLSRITSTDGYIDMPIVRIGTINTIIVNSISANLRITTTTSPIIIPINGIFVWQLLESFAGNITGVAVSTSSSTAVAIDVSIFGVQ